MLSVILLSYNSAKRIEKVFHDLTEILGENKIAFELLIIDDSSEDDSYEIGLRLEREHGNVRAYQLSRNCSSVYSVYAGLKLCRGDCAIPLPDDEQQPYHTIVEMHNLWKGGEKIILPYRDGRDEGLFKVFFNNCVYRILNLVTDVRFPPGGAETFFIDREVISIINNDVIPVNNSVIAEVLRLGFKPYLLPFTRPRGTNRKSRWTFKRKVRFFNDTFFSNSSLPVKLILYTGFFLIITGIGLIILNLCNAAGEKQVINGLTTNRGLLSVIILLSGIVATSLGVISAYIWRIYEIIKNRRGYIIREK